MVGTRRSTSDMDPFRRIMDFHQLEPEKVDWRISSLTTPWEVEEALKDVDQVYHTAGMVSFERRDSQRLIASNVWLTQRIVDACNRMNIPLCHFSSTSVFPTRDVVHVDWPLSNPEGPRSAYGESKYLAELEVWRGREEGLQAVIVNPGIVLGYGDWTSGSTALFKKAVSGFPFYTDGGTGFVGVQDVCSAAALLMEHQVFKERFLLVEGNYPFKVVQDMMADGFGSNQPRIRVGKAISQLIAAISAPMAWIGSKPLITRETARSAHRISRYDGTRVSQMISEFQYQPIEDVIGEACEAFKNRP